MSAADPTVYVVDDDEDIRSSLSRALGKRGFLVQTFGSAQDFLDKQDDTLFGCIILDYGMPGMNGLELQQALIENGTALPIIFITGHGGVPESVQAMKAGAVDFLEKPFRSELLVDRINAAFDKLTRTQAQRDKSAQACAKLSALTDREREIVDFIVVNPALATSKDIARVLDISPRTVDHHRARILEKMQIKSIMELIELSNIALLRKE